MHGPAQCGRPGPAFWAGIPILMKQKNF